MFNLAGIKRYKCRWYGLSFTKRGRRHYDKKRCILHAIDMKGVKVKAIELFGRAPDCIQRI